MLAVVATMFTTPADRKPAAVTFAVGLAGIHPRFVGVATGYTHDAGTVTFTDPIVCGVPLPGPLTIDCPHRDHLLIEHPVKVTDAVGMVVTAHLLYEPGDPF